MATDDTLTRARASVARLAKMVSDYDMAREQYDTFGDDPIEEQDLGEWMRGLRDDLRDPLLDAAPALLALADAVARLAGRDGTWWAFCGCDVYGCMQYACIACAKWSHEGSASVDHAPDCPVFAIDAALAALADATGEVGP